LGDHGLVHVFLL
jgi:hypothetical protein